MLWLQCGQHFSFRACLMLSMLVVCVSLALPGRYENSAVARARATFLIWGPAGGCTVVRKHHHRLTRYHYHLQSTSKSSDFNQYLVVSFLSVGSFLQIVIVIVIGIIVIGKHKDLQGGGWDLLNTKVLNSGEAFCSFTLLYFTGLRRTLIQVCYPLRKKNCELPRTED